MTKPKFSRPTFINCNGKTLLQKRNVWNLLLQAGADGTAIEDGMFETGSCWYNVDCFLVTSSMDVHPRNIRDITGDDDQISYEEFINIYGFSTWKEKYTNND